MTGAGGVLDPGPEAGRHLGLDRGNQADTFPLAAGLPPLVMSTKFGLVQAVGTRPALLCQTRPTRLTPEPSSLPTLVKF